MKLILLAITLLIFSSPSFAQTLHGRDVILPVIGEFPQSNPKYNELKSGSPYFQDEWVKAKLLANDGYVYKGIKIKLNLMDNHIHFVDESGSEKMIKSPLNQIEFEPNAKGSAYLFVSGNILPAPKKGWFQVLVNDSVTLLKSYEKAMVEHKSYGSPIEYRIDTKEKYSVVFNKQIYEIKKAADLTDAMPAKKTEIESHIKKNKSLSKEDQLISTVQYMNTIRK
jgi:hypothetical protein